MDKVFWLIFLYLVALALSVYVFMEFENANGLILCGAILLVAFYWYVSNFWILIVVHAMISFASAYYYFKSGSKATAVAAGVVMVLLAPYIIINLFIKRGESTETSIIIERKIDNLYHTI
jgi:hypothetical protein